MSGLIADSRTMVDKARVEAQVKPEFSMYKFSRLISIHFLKELVERNCSKIKASSFDDHFLNSVKFFC